VEAYRAHLEQLGLAPATVCKHLSALSGFFQYALDEGLVARNAAASARRPRLPDVSPRQALSVAEVRALLGAADCSKLIGLRDKAMVVTLVTQGWRISELLGLAVEDLGEEAGHRVATIVGKGGKVARVPLAAASWLAITRWCSAAGIESGPIFVRVTKGGEPVQGRAISQQATWKRLRMLARRAGIHRHLHAHLFRHTAVTIALDNGVPLHQVQDLARHADPRTTRRYDSHRQSLANPAPHVLAGVLVPEEGEEGADEES